MSNENKVEIEVAENLRRLCRTLRSNRARPELAIPAAQWETKLNDRIHELELLETPPLAGLRTKKETVAA